ncbi:hypothetical protein KXS07_37175 [Inquilinus limosus]|uniref:hypothetical protein n=1 Tax=Inquilinus limosus TaxID=171674 RepID=UPI003F14A41E
MPEHVVVMDLSAMVYGARDDAGMDRMAGGRALGFIGTAVFSDKAEELCCEHREDATVAQGDTNADKVADSEIVLNGKITLPKAIPGSRQSSLIQCCSRRSGGHPRYRLDTAEFLCLICLFKIYRMVVMNIIVILNEFIYYPRDFKLISVASDLFLSGPRSGGPFLEYDPCGMTVF